MRSYSWRHITAHLLCFVLLAAASVAAQTTSQIETVDAAERARLIDQILGKLRDFYVFPDTAEKMAADIWARERAGQYDQLAVNPIARTAVTQRYCLRKANYR